MKCRACGFEHGLDTCVVARAKRESAARLTAQVVANAGVNEVNKVVHEESPAVNKSNRGAYPDTDHRREYMREKMRKRRSEGLA